MSLMDRSIHGNIFTPLNGVDVDLSSIFFSNPRLPPSFNGNADSALNYIMAAIYPNYKGTVANPAALPLVGNLPNDYIIVSDDGDGKSAGYIWAVVDNAGTWSKKYDVDWSYEGIFAETINRTQYMYASKYGMTDKDDSGAAITGLYAGQKIYGGDQTTQNLTFNANSADGTGFVQTDNTFRPTTNNALDLGTTALKWRTGIFGTSVVVGTTTLTPAALSDSGGAFSFGSNNLTTTGSSTANSFVAGTLTMSATSIVNSSGSISFGATNLTTTGSVTAASLVTGTMSISAGSISDSSGTINFGSTNLTTTGTVTAGTVTFTQLNAGNIRITGNTISSQNANGNIILLPNGTGVIDLQKAATTLGITATGNISATGTGQFGNLLLSTNTLSSTNANGNIIISPNGAGQILITALIAPTTDAARDLGLAATRFKDVYFSGGLSDGTTSIAQSVLQSLRGINSGVTTGMTIFWNGTQWVPSLPDTEIVHNTLSGLTTGDAGHTQFVMLAGRSGGQVVQGGTAASDLLVFESTSNVTKGTVQTKDSFVPFTNASFSGTWSGIDLGNSSHYFRDLYTKGELKGLRFENLSSLPSNSAQNIGRAVYNTTDGKLYLDNGTAWALAGSSVEKFSSDTSWDGSTTVKNVTVSASITDARTALWQLLDNTNNFERIYTRIEATSATNVRITVSPALPAGSYRLLGVN